MRLSLAIERVETKSGIRYRVRFYQGRDPDTDKRRIVTRTFDKKKHADAELRRLGRLKDTGGMVAPSKEPLAKYLRRWLKEVMTGRISEGTWSDYSGVLRRYIESPPEGVYALGLVRIDRLTPQAIQTFPADLRDGRTGPPKSVRRYVQGPSIQGTTSASPPSWVSHWTVRTCTTATTGIPRARGAGGGRETTPLPAFLPHVRFTPYLRDAAIEGWGESEGRQRAAWPFFGGLHHGRLQRVAP